MDNEQMSTTNTNSNNKIDPVIVDLLKWLKENLPPDVDEDKIFDKVRVVQKIFEKLMALSFEEFYNFSNNDCKNTCLSLEEGVDNRLSELQELVRQNEQRIKKKDQLKEAREKLELIKKRHEFVSSLKLDGTMDLVKRYERLMPKK